MSTLKFTGLESVRRRIDGRSIQSTSYLYQATDSSTAPSSTIPSQDSPWVTLAEAMVPYGEDYPYLWRRQQINYSFGNPDVEVQLLSYFQKGDSGVSVDDIDDEYAVNNDDSTAPSSGWDTFDNVKSSLSSSNRFLWNREKVKYSDSSTYEYMDAHIIYRVSTDGVGISEVNEYYAYGNGSAPVSPASKTDPGWSTNWGTTEKTPSATTGQSHVWQVEEIVYTDNTSELLTAHIIAMWIKGNDGISVTGNTDLYAVNNSESTPPTLPSTSAGDSNWGSFDDVKSLLDADHRILWNVEFVHYSNDTERRLDAHVVYRLSTDGDDGNSLIGIDEYYAYGTSNAPVSPASKTDPGWSTNWGTDPKNPSAISGQQYVWQCEEVKFTDSTLDYLTTPHRISNHANAGSIVMIQYCYGSETEPENTDWIIGEEGFTIGFSTTIIGSTDRTNDWRADSLEPVEGKYIWMRTGTYDPDTQTEPTQWLVSRTSGNSVRVTKFEYGVSCSQSTEPSSYSETYPTLNQGDWLWTKTTYTDGTTAITKTLIGTDGEPAHIYDFEIDIQTYPSNLRLHTGYTEVHLTSIIQGYDNYSILWETSAGMFADTDDDETTSTNPTLRIPYTTTGVVTVTLSDTSTGTTVDPVEKNITAIDETEYDHDFGVVTDIPVYYTDESGRTCATLTGDFFVAGIDFEGDTPATTVTPQTGDNPSALHWDERTGSGTTIDPYVYTETTDTVVASGKTYYIVKYKKGVPFMLNNNAWIEMTATTGNAGRMLKVLANVLNQPTIQPSLGAIYGWFGNLVAQNAVIDNLTASNAFITALTASSAFITNLTAQTAFITSLFSKSITVANPGEIKSSNYAEPSTSDVCDDDASGVQGYDSYSFNATTFKNAVSGYGTYRFLCTEGGRYSGTWKLTKDTESTPIASGMSNSDMENYGVHITFDGEGTTAHTGDTIVVTYYQQTTEGQGFNLGSDGYLKCYGAVVSGNVQAKSFAFDDVGMKWGYFDISTTTDIDLTTDYGVDRGDLVTVHAAWLTSLPVPFASPSFSLILDDGARGFPVEEKIVDSNDVQIWYIRGTVSADYGLRIVTSKQVKLFIQAFHKN